jgi:hypothetical protein
VDVVRPHALDRLVLQPFVIDELAVHEVDRDVLGQPIGQDLHELLRVEARRPHGGHTDPFPVAELIEGLRVDLVEELGKPREGGPVEQSPDEGLAARVGALSAMTCGVHGSTSLPHPGTGP